MVNFRVMSLNVLMKLTIKQTNQTLNYITHSWKDVCVCVCVDDLEYRSQQSKLELWPARGHHLSHRERVCVCVHVSKGELNFAEQ